MVGPIFQWLCSIKGIADHTAAKLLALIDDISIPKHISSLWRYAGYGVIDGKAERNVAGEKSHKNNDLQTAVWFVSDQFVRFQTPIYVPYYYAEKDKYRVKYPEPVTVDGRTRYTDGHINNMAKRKMAKLFLSHLWVAWRTQDGLPVTEPYVMGMNHHSHYIRPQRSIWEFITPEWAEQKGLVVPAYAFRNAGGAGLSARGGTDESGVDLGQSGGPELQTWQEATLQPGSP
jgi:hypothetical protein